MNEKKNKMEVWGILNVTPDSFSDGGKYFSPAAALNHAALMQAQGVDVIDIGGESTRPGAEKVDGEEERGRILPVIRNIREGSGVPVSVDTYRADTARAALEAGADIVNDISGICDEKMAEVLAEYDCPYCLTFNENAPAKDDPGSVMERALSFFEAKCEYLISNGIKKENIIIDPGIGFAKSQPENVRLIKECAEFTKTGYRLLMGVSKKSVTAFLCGSGAEERAEATLALTAYFAMQGVDIVRVHDVSSNVNVIKTLNGVING